MQKFLTYNRFMRPFMDADGKGGSGGTDDGVNPKSDPKPDENNDKKYSDADLDAIISKKFAKWKADEEKRVKEAEKLAGMSAAEKAEHEKADAIARAEAAEAKLAHIDLVTEARNLLSDKKLSISESLLETIVGKDADTTKENIDNFVKLFTDAVDAAVKDKLKGKTPRTGGKANMTKEEISKIADPVARRKAIAENMELYE